MYVENYIEYSRNKTYKVFIGKVPLGDNEKIRLQSMTNTDTSDVEATVNQIIEITEAGADYVRLTVQTTRVAEKLKDIKKLLKEQGFDVPLIADIHFSPKAAEKSAEIIEKDPGVTARLLKIVNSAFFGFPSQISTVTRAITVVGIRELRDLVLATTVLELFNGLPNDLISMKSFWHQSLRCAVLSKVFASYHQNKNTIESIFIGGLLHEVGHLIIYSKLPELAREALSMHKFSAVGIDEAERQVIGFDYAAVGGELARAWKLPQVLQEVIEFHVQPEQAGEYRVEAAIVHIASKVADTDTFNPDEISKNYPPGSTAWKRAGLREDIFIESLQLAEEQYKVALALFPS